MSSLRRFDEKLASDRRFATWFYGAVTVGWVVLSSGLEGWRLVLHLFVVLCFGFVFASKLTRWRREGRWVAPNEPMGPLSTALQAELQTLIDAGQPIKAIKYLREQTGADLLTAKQIVDGLEDPPAPDPPTDR